MGPNTQKLVEVLGQIIEVLSSDGEKHWLIWMQDMQRRLNNADFSGVTKLLGAYGGMISFSDVVLNDRHRNDQLYLLRGKAYDLATEIEHDFLAD